MTPRIALTSVAFIAVSAPVFAQDFYVATCEGKSFKTVQSQVSVEEAKLTYAVQDDPTEPGQTLMRFESAKRGRQYWGWTSAPVKELEGHCVTQYYLARKPKDGTWLITHDDVSFTGCPEGVAVPSGMTGTRNLTWPNFFTPKPFFEGSALTFDLDRLDYEHWTAQADPLPNVPGTVDVRYEFKVASPEQIDITGSVNLKIDGGAIKADCTGNITMTAQRQG